MSNSDILSKVKTETLQVRVTTDLKKKLEALAMRENTSVSRLLLVSIAKQYPELVDDILKH